MTYKHTHDNDLQKKIRPSTNFSVTKRILYHNLSGHIEHQNPLDDKVNLHPSIIHHNVIEN